jgi:hypothetical protein
LSNEGLESHKTQREHTYDDLWANLKQVNYCAHQLHKIYQSNDKRNTLYDNGAGEAGKEKYRYNSLSAAKRRKM